MTTTTKELTIYKFKESPVRLLVDDKGEPWFIANDAGNILGLSDTRKSVNLLDEDERNTIPVIDSMGRPQDTFIISEPGLYKLILKSRKPQAKEFQRWVTHDVLPSIRKTGGYAANGLIAELEARIVKLERGGRHLLLQPIPEISARARLNMIIRRFVAKQEELGYAYSYPDAWRELYYQHKYRYHEDLRSRARNRKCDPLDCATPKELEDLVNLAGHIFIEN